MTGWAYLSAPSNACFLIRIFDKHAMRLLFLSSTFPLPPNNGYRMRVWALLRALHAEGHEIRLLCLAHPDELNVDDAPLREICAAIEVIPLAWKSASVGQNYGELLRKAFSAMPYGVSRFNSPEMRSLIAAQAVDVDAVFAETPYPMANMPESVGVPLILDNQNVEHMLLQRYVKQEKNLAKRAYAWLESVKLRRWEEACCVRSAVVLVCSEQDRSIMQQFCPSTPAVVVPNTIDVDTYVPVPEADPNTIVYSGRLDWFPNRDAVEYFAFEILPVIRRLRPGVRFVVAGRTAPEEYRKRFESMTDVEFTGTVPDMRVEIGKAAVCVVPLRIGSGTKLKILEAAAMCKPIVSTMVGVEGLDFDNGREIVIADDPEKFAQAVARLMDDAKSREQLGGAARKRVVESYSFSSLRKGLRRGLEPLTRNGAGVAANTTR